MFARHPPPEGSGRCLSVPDRVRRREDQGQRPLRFSTEALELLAQGHYTGNVRELRNLVERASILANGDEIRPEDPLTDEELPPAADAGGQAAEAAPADASFCIPWILSLDEAERRYIAWRSEERRVGK